MNFIRNSVVPVGTVLLAILALWYAFAIILNAPFERDQAARANTTISTRQLIANTMAQERPVLPAPHQVAEEIRKTVFDISPTSKRSLVYHGGVTLSSTLLGFGLGTLLGILLAIAIVHSRTLDKSLMPWIITSQTVPILAIAPMIIVVLNAVNITGLLPKAMISTYLSFFPVAVGMVKGLRSPEIMHLDLMHTYNASKAQVFWKLRWPASMPYLFTSMKIAVAISLVGTPITSIGGNISLPLEVMGVPKAERASRIAKNLELVNLAGFEKKFPWQLSGGMQQRASIARALSFDPDMLLMDEPFGALDEIVRDHLNEELLKLWAKTQKTVIFVTHSIPEAVFLSTKIVVMSPRPGRIHEIIDCNLGTERTLDIRETPEFLEIAHRVREGLRHGHSYDE